MWTNGGLKRVLEGSLNLTSATVKVMLLDAAYVPNPDHEFVSSLSANELSGTGYVAGFGNSGRKTLASKTFTKDDTNDCATFDAADPVWSGADFGTAGYAALIVESVSDAASPVLATLPIANGLAQGGTFTLQLGAFALKLRAV
jgi:hypothetical protein